MGGFLFRQRGKSRREESAVHGNVVWYRPQRIHKPRGKSDLEVSQVALPELTSASRTEHAKQNSMRISGATRCLLGLLKLAAAHLLCLEVLVQQEQCRLVGLGSAHDGEHALASLIMRRLGDGDAST